MTDWLKLDINYRKQEKKSIDWLKLDSKVKWVIEVGSESTV